MRVARVFIDSNVLLYTRDAELSDKANTALTWLRALAQSDAGCINLQVLNEITHVMLRKRQDLPAETVFASVDELRVLGTSPIDRQTTLRAREVRMHTSYSWWDCLLLASAVELGCSHFLSEDLQDGHAIQGLTIIDPFAHSPDTFFSPR